MAEYLQSLDFDENDPIALVKHFIRAHFQAVSSNPDFVKILASVLSSEPEMVQQILNKWSHEPIAQMPAKMLKALENGISEKQFRSINTKQILISIIGMNLFYFLGKPIAEVFLELDVVDEELFLLESTFV